MKGKRNIALIGMPGCGKSYLGKILSNKLKMNLVDVDLYIEEKENKTIKDIFKKGEETFRKIESRYVEEVSKLESTVICTGGGVVKIEENMKNLKKNSIIVFINRPLDNILKDIRLESRPLLKNGKEKIYKLYEERYGLYKKYCHVEVINDKSAEDVIKEIIDKVENYNNEW